MNEFNTRCLIAKEEDLRDNCPCQYGQIGTVHHGIGIGAEDGMAPPILDIQFGYGAAAVRFHQRSILSVEPWKPGRLCCFEKGGRKRCVGIRCYIDSTIAAAVFDICISAPVLDLMVYLANRFVTPCRIPCAFCEEVPVILVTYGPYARVDAGPSTKNLAQWVWDGALLKMLFWLCFKLPGQI